MTAYAFSDVLFHNSEPAIRPYLLRADVEFGVLQSNGNCVNIGICRINTNRQTRPPVTRTKNRGCPFAEALLSVSAKGRLQIFFPRLGMKPCTERVFFRGPVFPVPMPYFLPESVRTDLPGLRHEIIAAGLYPIRRNAEGYFVEF